MPFLVYFRCFVVVVEILIREAVCIRRRESYPSQFGQHRIRIDSTKDFAVFHEYVQLVTNLLHTRKAHDIAHHLMHLCPFFIIGNFNMDILKFGNRLRIVHRFNIFSIGHKCLYDVRYIGPSRNMDSQIFMMILTIIVDRPYLNICAHCFSKKSTDAGAKDMVGKPVEMPHTPAPRYR